MAESEQEQPVQIPLTDDEAVTIIGALGQLPYQEVHQVIQILASRVGIARQKAGKLDTEAGA